VTMPPSDVGRYGTAWQRDEIVLALYLYCQTPFRQTTARNPDVQRLALLLGRTPASVARKLGNFGAFDPTLAAQGISGLSHASAADRAVWDEFNGRWGALVAESERLLALLPVLPQEEVPATQAPLWIPPTGPTATPRTIMARRVQSFFRRTVLASYAEQCCVCGIDLLPLLVASHIIPWARREDTRTDPQNGLCLCALHDRAFDNGLLGITPQYEVVVSPLLARSRAAWTQTALRDFAGHPILLPQRFAPKPEFLQWHTEQVFQAG